MGEFFFCCKIKTWRWRDTVAAAAQRAKVKLILLHFSNRLTPLYNKAKQQQHTAKGIRGYLLHFLFTFQ